MTDNNNRHGRISHKGISLVEIVVIVAIIGILGGVMGYNIAVTNGYRARQCKNMMATAIQELKIKTLSKAVATGDTYMKIYKEDKKIYCKVFYKEGGVEKAEEPKEIGKRISVTFGGTSHTEEAIGDEANTNLIICYNRATGAMVNKANTSSLSDIEYIKASSGPTKEYKIEMVPATGKVINKTDKS